MKIESLFCRRPLFCLALLLLAGPAWAQAARYDGTNWAFLDTKRVLAAAADLTLARYPDCDEATVEKKMVRVYRPDGTGESQDEGFVKVLTEKGKRNNRTLTLNFTLPYFTVEVVKLEVLKPDGTVVEVDVAANSKETIDETQMSMNIYDPNNRVLQVNIPKLEINDVLHSITRLTVNRAIIPGEFAEYNIFEGPGYIRHTSYEVRAPAAKPLTRVFLRDEIPGTVSYSKQPGEAGGLVHRWEVNNVPRMFDEPSMPSYEAVLQRLLVGTTPDWAAVSQWYWQLSQPHLEATSPELRRQVDELVADAPSEMDKIKAVFYHVSKKVRYMGLTPEKDRPGFEPHDVKLTFEKKYGVCRDKAALLVSMLQAAGLKAYPVLISVGVKRDQDVGGPFFNHAIVSVERHPGDYVLMDPTDENTRELLPAMDCNQSYLVCRPEGENLKTSPIKPAEDNLMRIKTTGVLNGAGKLEAKSELWFEGVNDNSYRDAFAHMKPDDQRRFFERDLKSIMPGARLKSLKLTPTDMLDVSASVHAELEFSVDSLTAADNGKAVVSVPWIGKGMGIVNFILGGAGLEKRKYPMETFVACGLKEEVNIQLADGFAGPVSLPVCAPMDDKSLSYQQAFDCAEGMLNCARELKLKVVEFSPTEYLELKKALKNLEFDARKAPVLAVRGTPPASLASDGEGSPDKGVDSDARILESRKTLEVKDAHTAVYRIKYAKRILTYAGKIREAELKVDYNPSCQEAKLVSAAVTSKNGKRQEISKGEINVMDAGWNASAKRYTGGKILVANLPGVDIGSTIEVEFEITTKNKPFLSGFESFQLPDELDSKTFKLTAPAGVTVHKLVTGKPGVVQEDAKAADGQQVFEWRSEHVKALPAESELPPEWVYNAGVGYFIGDSASYFSQLREAMVEHSRKGLKAVETAKRLTASCTNQLEAVQAIRDFIAKSIRSAGPSFTDLPLSELSDADTTLADGYGHWADRAILFHAMLAGAGFKPELVLASGLPPIAGITNVVSSLPLPHSFEAPLVRVSIQGQNYYLNDTDQYSRLGSTSYNGRLARVLANQRLETIHAAKECQDQTDTLYTLSLADDGKTRVSIARKYYGANYNQKNRYFSELPPEERRRYYQEIVSDVAQGARPVGDLTTKFDVYPGLEEFTVEIDNYGVVDGKYCYFDLPFTPSMFPAGSDQRTLPLFLSDQSQNTIRTEIELPPGFRQVVVSPKSQELDAPGGGGKARIVLAQESGKCVITHQLELAPAIVSPKDYAAMQQVESTLGKKSSKVFLLERN